MKLGLSMPPRAQLRVLRLLGFATLTLLVGVFVLTLTTPYIGVELNKSGGSWVVAVSDPLGAGHAAGIRVNDVALEVNKEPVSSYAAGQTRLRLVQVDELTIQDARGTERAISFQGIAPNMESSSGPTSLFLIGLFFWALGAFVYYKRPMDKPAILLYLLGMVVSSALVGVSAGSRGVPGAIPLQIVMFLLVPSLFVHLFLSFPVNLLPASRLHKFFPVIYGSTIILLAAYVAFGHNPNVLYPFFRSVVLFHLSAGLLAGVGILAFTYAKTSSYETRSALNIVLAGTILGIAPFVLLSALPEVFLGQVLVIPQLTIFSTILIPLSLGYAILRHHLMDVDFYINRALVFGTLTTSMLFLYAILTLAVSGLLGRTDQASTTVIIIILSSIVAVLFVPLRDRIQARIDQLLYGANLDYQQALRATSGSFLLGANVHGIVHFLAQTVVDAMGLYGACILQTNGSVRHLVISAIGSYDKDKALQRRMAKYSQAIARWDVPTGPVPRSSGAAFLVSLKLRDAGQIVMFLDAKKSGENFGHEDVSFLETIADQAAIAIDNAILAERQIEQQASLELANLQLTERTKALETYKRLLETAYVDVAQTLAILVEARDPYTRGHSERVARYARRISVQLELPRQEINNITMAAQLHDVGKVGITDAILQKPGHLDPSERAVIELHPQRSVEILRFLPFLQELFPLIRHHHEHFDGTGYPDGLAGSEIPLGARIIAVADAYEALTSDRPYRAALSAFEALYVLEKGMGSQWDPDVINAFRRAIATVVER